MARVFIDGWETGSFDAWTTGESYGGGDYAGAFSIPAEPLNDNTGTFSLKGSTTTYWKRLGRALPSDFTELFVSFRFKAGSITGPYGGADTEVINFMHGSSTLACLAFNNCTSDAGIGKWYAYRNSTRASPTLLATSTNAYVATTIRRIQVWYKPLNSGGRFKVWIDGVLEIDYTGDTTYDAEHCDRVDLCTWGGFYGFTGTHWWDDLIIDDATLPANNKIFGIVPTGAGNSTQLTPSTGSNYACVDEVPAVDTDYVSTNAADDLDLYACGDLPAACTNVVSVQVEARVEKTDTPTPTTIGLALRTGSTNYASAGKAVTAAWTRIVNLWETNPNTSAEWTEAQVNALEIGVKALA